jgi:hypothetical protein
MAGIKIVDLPAVGRDLAATDLFEMSLAGGTGSRKITGQEIMNASKLNVGSTPVINGLGGGVFFQGTGNVLQQSANINWDNPNQTLYIGGAISLGGNTDQIKASSGSGNFDFLSNLPIRFLLKSGSVERMRIVSSTGNVLIGTTTDAGFKLDVNGTARVQTSLLLGSSSISASAYPLQVVGGAGGSALFSNTTRTQALNINLTTANETRIYTDYFLTGADQKLILGTFANRANQLVLNTTGNVLINTTTDAGFRLDVNGTARVSGGVTSGVALVGTWSVSASYARFGHNLFNGGTTFGFLQQQNGDCFINGLSNFISASNNNIFETNGAERMRITSSGNVLIGTTTNGASRLRVVGLPTSPVGLSSGDVWNNLGILTIV